MPDIQNAPNMPQGGYPDAAQLPEVNGQADALSKGAPNPLSEALTTLGQFILSNGGNDPNSPLKMLFKALVEEMGKVGQGGAAPAQPPAPGALPPPPGPTPPTAPSPMDRPIGAFAGGPGGQDQNAAPGAKLFV